MSSNRDRGAVPGTRALVITTLVLGATHLACGDHAPLVEIARLEETRNPGDGRLAAYLADPSAGVRARAARAAGRLQLPSLADDLRPLLDDGDPAVVQAALFALGQIALGELRPCCGSPSSTGALSSLPGQWRAEAARAPRCPAAESVAAMLASRVPAQLPADEETARELAAALGKTATALALDPLSVLCRDPRPKVRAEALAGLARLPDPPVVSLVVPALGDSAPEVRRTAAWVVGRHPDRAALRALVPLLGDPQAEVRAVAARALGWAGDACDSLGGGEDPKAALVRHLQRGEFDTRVQVASLIALGRLRAREDLPEVRRYLQALWPQVRAAAATALAAFPDEATPDLIRLSEDANPMVRQAAIHGLAASTHPAARTQLLALTRHPSPWARRAARVAAATLDSTLVQARDFVVDPDPLVRCAAVRALSELGGPDELEIVRRAVRDSDPLVAAEAIAGVSSLSRRSHRDEDGGASGLAAHGGSESQPASGDLLTLYRPGAALPVKRALAGAVVSDPGIEPLALLPLLRDPDYHVRTTVYDAFVARLPSPLDRRVPSSGQIESRARPLREASPVLDVDELPRRAEIVIEGGRSIVIRLHARLAPRTVANFVRLARSGYFDGQAFFRVAPDSIVVSGCPRGDGFGGPGYTIPCEINPARFERGSVAMYLEGKDTGGSCFFITLTPQPELDGLYTVFGSVVHGMALVDAMGVGVRVSRVIVG